MKSLYQASHNDIQRRLKMEEEMINLSLTKDEFGMIQEFIEEHLAEQSPISNETMKRVNSLLL